MSVGASAVRCGRVGLSGRPWGESVTINIPQRKGIILNHHSFDSKTYARRYSNRLPSYDYRSSGAYFVTMCTHKRQRVLEIPIIHTALLERWHQLPQRFPGVRLDAFVIMPDHVHCILWLDGNMKDTPTLGRVIGALKAWVTIAWRKYHRDAQISCLRHLWQRLL
jgi:REP element-mobilizing transposase RayT